MCQGIQNEILDVTINKAIKDVLSLRNAEERDKKKWVQKAVKQAKQS